MRIFLTGGTGFIGQALARTIRQRGWQLDALVRQAEGAPARWPASIGATLVRGDITQRDSMRKAMQHADIVIHNAGVYEFGADSALRRRMRDANVRGTECTLSLALELRVPRTLYVSTTYAIGGTPKAQVCDETHTRQIPPVHYYEQTKAEAHEPPMGWCPQMIISLVEVNALAEGIVLAAEKGRLGEAYLFCGEPTSIRQMFGHWRAHRGGFTPKLWLPPWLMKLQFAPLEPLQRALGLPAFFSRESVAAATVSLNYVSNKARRELGWAHPTAAEMWPRIIRRERELLAQRRGLRAKLRPAAVAV